MTKTIDALTRGALSPALDWRAKTVMVYVPAALGVQP